MSVYDRRRENARLLASEVGGICSFAKKVHKAQSQISHLIGINTRRKIGDKLSTQIERSFNKPRGWLDQNNSAPSYKSVPVITWQQVVDWCELKNTNTLQYDPIELIPAMVSVGSNSYALRVESDCMESSEGISFIKKSIIIVDPDQPAISGDYIIIQLSENEVATFRQLNIDGGINYAKPLNLRYPVAEIDHPLISYGVICQQYIDIKLITSPRR